MGLNLHRYNVVDILIMAKIIRIVADELGISVNSLDENAEKIIQARYDTIIKEIEEHKK